MSWAQSLLGILAPSAHPPGSPSLTKTNTQTFKKKIEERNSRLKHSLPQIKNLMKVITKENLEIKIQKQEEHRRRAIAIKY